MKAFLGSRRVQLRHSRRGAVVVQVAVMSTLIMGMGALTIDIGAMYVTQAELQAAADSAALAAAARLGGSDGGVSPQDLARESAMEFAERHRLGRYGLQMDPNDVEFGRATFDASSGRFDFTPQSSGNVDSIRVTARRSTGSSNGALPMTFANIFGFSSKDLWANATATLIPRDISVVIDLSGSMTYDSEMMYWNRTDGGFANTRDIWAALNGPEPDRPYMPGSELETEYASDTGPTYGNMTEWGTPLLPGSYSATSDPGLFYIKKGSSINGTTLTALQTKLQTRGYNAAEQSALVGNLNSNDNTTSNWQNRAGVLLGLATWRSGKAGSTMGSGGDGDNLVENAEVTWNAAPSGCTWNWRNYVDWVQASASDHNYRAISSNTGFRYRYGLKTMTDFIIDDRPSNSQSNMLWATPQQPLRAVKDAVQTLADTIDALDSPDQLSLETFGTTSVHEINLSETLQQVPTRLYQRQAAHFNGTTNIGAGITRAINELKSARARPVAKKVIVLMSDGVPNVNEGGAYDVAGGRAYAIAAAEAAADEGMVIYAVSVGYGADRPLMQEIASATGGQEFFASGSPEEYTEQLEQIFRALGGRRPVALIE